MSDFTKNPYKVTAAMAATLRNTAGALFTSGAINVQRVLWVNPASIGDKFNIDSDISGTPLDAGECAAANKEVDHEFGPSGIDVFDFKVTQLDSGTLFIFCY